MFQKQLHCNSQKRFYISGGVYFLTTVTYQRFSYFHEEILRELFELNLKYCRQIKKFELFAYVLGEDHAHFLLRPDDEYDYSNIMHFVKRHVSREINHVMNCTDDLKGEDRDPRLWDLDKYRKRFIAKYGNLQYIIPKFKWQSSFHFHHIMDERDLESHWRHIIYHRYKNNRRR